MTIENQKTSDAKALPAETSVLIVGAGPVGLALAIDLGSRGIPCVILDKGDGIVRHSKMGAVSARTMEFCRQWGFVDKVRNAGFPSRYKPNQVFCTDLSSHLIGLAEYPSVAEEPDTPESPERKQRCPQIWFDPILQSVATDLDNVTMGYQTEVLSLSEDEQGVLAHISSVAGGDKTIRAKFAVGCDGAASEVRASLGIAMSGENVLNYSVGVFLKCPDLLAFHDKGEAERYIFAGEEGNWGHLTVVDGHSLWRLTVMGGRDRLDMDSFDPHYWVRRCFGRDDIPYEIISVLPWRRSKLVADHYRSGRIFLCGDAVHAMSPNGGYGMNTGIGDAADLGWKLQAVLQGWAPMRLLDTYEIERRPVGLRNTYAAAGNFARILNAINWTSISDDTPRGAAKRAAVGQELVQAASGNVEVLGISLGHRYENSPIIVPDGTAPTPDDAKEYVPTSRPGHRAPHAWMPDGRSTLDLFGRSFVLLRFGDDGRSLAGFVKAAEDRKIPLQVVAIDDTAIATLYERRFVLVRPDGHVAWRSDDLPSNPDSIWETVVGCAVKAATEDAGQQRARI